MSVLLDSSGLDLLDSAGLALLDSVSEAVAADINAAAAFGATFGGGAAALGPIAAAVAAAYAVSAGPVARIAALDVAAGATAGLTGRATTFAQLTAGATAAATMATLAAASGAVSAAAAGGAVVTGQAATLAAIAAAAAALVDMSGKQVILGQVAAAAQAAATTAATAAAIASLTSRSETSHLSPDAIISSANLVGTVADIDEPILAGDLMVDFGVANTSVYYDTVNPSVTLPVPVSMSIWFQPVRDSGNSYETIVAHSYDSSRGITVYYRGPSAGFPNSFRVVIVAAGFSAEAILQSAPNIATMDQAALITITITATDQYLYYCPENGAVVELVHTIENIASLGVPFTATRFGQGDASPLWFSQKLGPVGVYNKELTPTEVRALANGSSPGDIGGVIALWEFGPDPTSVPETIGGLIATRHP